jgi:hypothetical protein
MRSLNRPVRAERGMALVNVMMAIFVLTVVVATTAIATMGEATLSFDQMRGQQALAIAEAGAYRALAELRRRLTVDLDAQVRRPTTSTLDIRHICRSKEAPPPGPSREIVEIVTNYAYPLALARSDWTRVGETGMLRLGTPAARIRITDVETGRVIGAFDATVHVRWSGAPASCRYGGDQPERETMEFDYAIVATGWSGTATRTVCLRSPFADRCADWLPSANPTDWAGSYALTGGAYRGWPVVIERASYAQWGLLSLDASDTWLATGARLDGPVHSNAEIRVAGNPEFSGMVTQVTPAMRFHNCGVANSIAIQDPPADPNGYLENPGCDDPTFGNAVRGGGQGVTPIPTPAAANPSRASVGLSPVGPNATDQEVNDRTTDLPDGTAPVPHGVYVMDQCGAPGCGGIYIRGDVAELALASSGGHQEIFVTVDAPADPARAKMRIVLEPITRAVTTYWGPGWSSSRAYPAGTFNGVLYVSGSITSNADPAVSSGLYGVVNRQMRLTIAAHGEMRITDHLVYEAPPAGPGDDPANVLGLYSVSSDVTLVGALAPTDLYIDAAVLAPSGRFWVEGWDRIPPRGNVYFLGATVQRSLGAFGGFGPQSGYGRVMTFDRRLRSTVSPPFFPQSGVYTAIRWPAAGAAFPDGDALYDRPAWEELIGP